MPTLPASFLRLALCGLLASVSAFAGKTILVVESYHAAYAWDASYTQALQESLGQDHRLVFFRMDTKRLPQKQHAAMAEKAWQRYQTLKPDLVILGDDAAMQYLARRFAGTATPVVFLGVNQNPRAYYDTATTRNITGVLERPLLKRNILIASRLVGEVKRVLVLFDTDITSQVVLSETFGGRSQTDIHGIQLDIRLLGDWASWQKAVDVSGKDYDILVAGLYQTLRDAQGRTVDPERVIRWTSAHAPVPTFAFWDFAVGSDKTIGGLVLCGKEQGRAAAELVRQVFAGASPSSLGPVTADRGRLLLSRTQLRKHGLTVPADLEPEVAYIE